MIFLYSNFEFFSHCSSGYADNFTDFYIESQEDFVFLDVNEGYGIFWTKDVFVFTFDILFLIF
jgi:hypothetical protein